MATLVIDTYQFVTTLKASGVPEGQARAIAEGLRSAELQHVATKEDLLELKIDLFKWLIPLLLGQAGFIVALVKLL